VVDLHVRVKAVSDFIKAVEQLLLPYTRDCTPVGSDPRAVVHQWMHAIASNEQLAGRLNKKQTAVVINTLKESSLYLSDSKFKNKLYKEINFPPKKSPKFRFIDLFAGIGGFRFALQELGGLCSFSSEWEKSAQLTYMKNYGEIPFGDITSFTSEFISDRELSALIPDHEILAAGFPCQPFSNAGVSARNAVGKAHGFKCNTQGTLFFDVMRIVSVKKPKVIFLENVRNIERHDSGRTFKIIKDSIEDLGYDFKHAIIDSSSLVPQRRVRCYIVCFRRDLNIDFKFPLFNGQPIPLKSILETEVGDEYTISDKLWLGHKNRTKRNLNRGTGFTAFVADINKPSKTLVARYGKDGKECLIPQGDRNPRLLTPRECAKLQGYPERFIFPDARIHAYKQFGNSVAVPVISKIAKVILKELL
jgi:DNA (cytosine-5)-methyltransferase 1